MTEELLIRDRVEIERRRDERASNDRINSVEKDFAVLKTLFDATIKSILEKLGDSVSDEDLKELKREWETALRDTITNIREHFNTANEQQSAALIGHVQTLLANERLASAEDQKNLRRQMFFALFTWGLGIIGALFIFWLTTGRP